MSVEATHRNGAAAHEGLATARVLARPGIAIAASAPIALVALSYIPRIPPTRHGGVRAQRGRYCNPGPGGGVGLL